MSNESFNVPLNVMREMLQEDMKNAEDIQKRVDKMKEDITRQLNTVDIINNRIDQYQKAIRLLEGAFDSK